MQDAFPACMLGMLNAVPPAGRGCAGEAARGARGRGGRRSVVKAWIAVALVLAAAGCSRSDSPPPGATATATAPAPSKDPGAARKLIAAGAVVLDVRTPDEYAAAHLPQAINIPVQELPARIGEVDK